MKMTIKGIVHVSGALLARVRNMVVPSMVAPSTEAHNMEAPNMVVHNMAVHNITEEEVITTNTEVHSTVQLSINAIINTRMLSQSREMTKIRTAQPITEPAISKAQQLQIAQVYLLTLLLARVPLTMQRHNSNNVIMNKAVVALSVLEIRLKWLTTTCKARFTQRMQQVPRT